MKNILLLDDSATIRHSLRALLEQKGDWICGEAENGREGVDQAVKNHPDLIVLDLSMPVMNGFQAARELRRLLPNVPILMFTTFNSGYVEKEALAAGVWGVYSKSAGTDSLYRAMLGLLKAA